MRLPKGYRAPEVVYSVESYDGEGRLLGQYGAFFSEEVALECKARLEAEGVGGLAIDLVSVHARLQDWEFDR